MKQASRKKPKIDLSTSSNSSFSYYLREGLMIVGCALSSFLLLSLLTYHQSDPGWTSTGVGTQIANAGGIVGAWYADFTLFLFGYAAYLFPFILGFLCWMVFFDKHEQAFPSKFILAIRISGFLMFFLAICGLFSFEFTFTTKHLPYHAGGVLGNVIAEGLVEAFNPTGTSLILLAFFCSGLTLFLNISWLTVLEASGKIILTIFSFVKKTFENFKTRSHEKISETQPVALQSKEKVEDIIYPKEPTLPMKIEIPQKPTPSPKPIIIKPIVKREPKIAKPIDPNMNFPSLDLLDPPDENITPAHNPEKLEQLSREVEMRLKDFGLDVHVVAVHPGPVITRFEMELAPGIKVSRISSLAKDLARSLSVTSVRIVEVIPGKSVVGLELPNDHREIVRLREVLSSQAYEQARSPVTLALGKDIAGHPVIVDLAKMPHLLVAGTTGSGKSVGINAMLLGLLFKATPKDLRMILVDPKMLELSIYEGIPHLLAPVVTDMKEAANALRWCVAEMERRYKLMAALGVRNIAGYNTKIREAEKKGEPILHPIYKNEMGEAPPLEPVPYIVVVIDEYADMMMVVGKKVEQLIARLAQKARASGIHLILATQRPSVDVITGLIKANIPTRIAYQVSSKIDSRTVLDQGGAEQLLGHGDMLYLPPGTSVPVRIHGAFVADDEVHQVVASWRLLGEPEYIEEITEDQTPNLGSSSFGSFDMSEDGISNGEKDPFYDEAVFIVTKTRRATISSIQRRFKIGYNRAARLIEEMEAAGVVSRMESNGMREVLAPPPIED